MTRANNKEISKISKISASGGKIQAFAKEHQGEDTARLLLSAARYPDIDMPAAVQQIEGLRTARDKWPSLLQCEEYLYPPRLNREQASSEATASYKASLLSTLNSQLSTHHLIDLTGGMGIDTIAFARVGATVDYVERDPQLCELMQHNIAALGLDNISVHCADSIEWLEETLNTQHLTLNTIYLDPARRDSHGRKVAAFEDCTPDILAHLPLLRSHCEKLIIKASPMIDIDLACRQLANVAEVHIVALKGECKEVLFVCGGDAAEPMIKCVNLNDYQSTPIVFSFTRSAEASADTAYCQAVGRYLYEPDAALMKGGPYKLIGQEWGLAKLARNTHLYTSDDLKPDFPGRTFEVLQEVKLDRKTMEQHVLQGRAHVVTRNYPVEAASLQRQLGLKEGGELFVVATTIGTRRCGFLAKICND